MITKIAFLLLLAVFTQTIIIEEVPTYALSTFYCGFSQTFCGDSKADDVNPKSDYVVLAYASTQKDGSVIFDDKNYPASQVATWRQKGKSIIISSNGLNNSWAYIFSAQDHTDNFVKTMTQLIHRFDFDGVDLNINSYEFGAKKVVAMIMSLKQSIGNKLLIVSPQDQSVYQGAPVPDPNFGTPGSTNYYVYIVNMADQYIDFYQVKCYDSWFDAQPAGSLDYIKDVYLNWRNLQGMSKIHKPIPGFLGVNGNKLLMGLKGSKDTGQSEYYTQPNTIRAFKTFIEQSHFPLKGFMVWNSHFDSQNNMAISNVIKQQ